MVSFQLCLLRRDDGTVSDNVYLSLVRRRIQRARLAERLRQEDLAEKLGISVRSYQRYESGSREKVFNPYVTTLRKIARAIGVDVAAIVAEPTKRELEDTAGHSHPQRVRRGRGKAN